MDEEEVRIGEEEERWSDCRKPREKDDISLNKDR